MVSLESRVATLEQRLARSRIATICLTAVILTAALLGVTSETRRDRDPRTIRTNRLEIVNAKGETAFVVEGADDGGRWLLFNNAGQAVAKAVTKADGAVISVGSTSNKPLAVLDCTKDGGEVNVSNDLAIVSARMAAREYGGGMDIFNNLKKSVYSVAAGGPNGGRMTLFNQMGNGVITAVAMPAQGQIFVGDNEGTTIWKAP